MSMRCALAFVALVPLAACGGREPAVEEARPTVVSVAAARTDELRDVASVSGTIVPSSVADLTIYAPEAAEILELPKKPDDPVQIGDVLVRFDIASLNQELAALELEVLDAQSRFDRAQSELTRQADLFARGIASRNAHEDAKLAQATAESALGAARNRLDTARAGQTRSVIRATFSGVVAGLWHAERDTVRPDPSDPIIRIIDPSRVQVSVQLPIVQLARVVPGQTATVRAIAGAVDEEATVASKAQLIDPAAPTGEVRLNFVQPATLPLDTPVSVSILLDRRAEAVIVPTQAVIRDEAGTWVMVAGEDGIARRRAIRQGLVAGQLTQIADGLSDGERVIISTPADIVDGEAIAIAR
ncbi:MAG: hypothetical protein ABS36_12165 [Acidobacteria bacterium SCN 69-37]|nr:MAG: hypothetical protein ABS36_12165 [Acidobacteria bacterium SCN 69-37]